MSGHFHAIVWIDHLEARVFHFSATEADQVTIRPHHPNRHIHHKANSIGSGNAAENQAFFHDVAAEIAKAGEVLITGPANAKTELVKHIHRHDPKLVEKIVGIETLDHPTDGQLLAHARTYFKAADWLIA